MSNSSVPQIQFTPAGVIIPSEAEILAGQIADINTAFGGGLNPDLRTPQGQLASSITAAIGDKNAEIAYIVNQLDPRFSSGRFQDAIAQIYFLERKPATSTRVLCTLTGVTGLVVPAGTLAADTSGNIYKLVDSVYFFGSNTGEGYFENVETGPIPCPATTLNRIYNAIAGLDAITNAADGVLGRDVESRQDFEFRRFNSVALNSHGGIGAIRAAVFNVDGVTDCYVYENRTGTDDSVGPTLVTVLKNSVYVCVSGGNNMAIAEAIFKKISNGCNTNGSTTMNVVDREGFLIPPPAYPIRFQRPTEVPIKFLVQVAASSSLPTNIVDDIKAAIIARFNGSDSLGERERIGGSIYSSRYSDAVAIGGARILDLLVGYGAPAPSQHVLGIGINEQPTISASNITVSFL